MADTRKIFPTEKVMELVTGKQGANVNDLSSHVLGTPVNSPEQAKAAAPFATAWLARWYPKFTDLEWKEGENWEAFLKQAKAKLGDNISIQPMSGKMKELAAAVLDRLKQAHESLLRQTDAAARLEAKVRQLEPLEAATKALQKKNDELETKLKTMKADMGALQRKVNEYQGKLAIDNTELMQTIKDAIKDGLKGVTVGAATASAATASTEAAQPLSEEDEWSATPKHDSDDEWG